MTGLKKLLSEYGIEEKETINEWKERIESDGLENESAKDFRRLLTILSGHNIETMEDFDTDYTLFIYYCEGEILFTSNLDFYGYAQDSCEYEDSLSDFLELISSYDEIEIEDFKKFRELFANIIDNNEIELNNDISELLEHYQEIRESVEDIRDIDERSYMMFLSLKDMGHDVTYDECVTLVEKMDSMNVGEVSIKEENKCSC